MYKPMCVHICTYKYVSEYTFVYAFVYLCVWMCLYMYVFVCMCVFLFACFRNYNPMLLTMYNGSASLLLPPFYKQYVTL